MFLSTFFTLMASTLSLLAVHALAPPDMKMHDQTQVAAGWYQGYQANDGFPPSKISWYKYTHLIYSFAETTRDVNVLSLEKSNPEGLPQFVTEARRHGVKAMVSVGGWTGSRWWSSNVGSAENRTAFVRTLSSLVRRYDLDGLDFDWEYPGRQGAGFNVVSKHDAANFLSFLEELRKDPVGSSLVLSACTSVVPFAGEDGKPSGDISGFSMFLNFINVMNYDVWGPWSNSVGPNAPLDDACAAPEYQIASATSAVRLWTNAGMPPQQIVLAVAAYGRAYRVRRSDAFMGGSSSLASYPPFVKTRRDPRPCSEDRIDECALAPLAQGELDFKRIIQEGYLNKNGTPRPGITYRYDDCSQTPYVYNKETQSMVSYDDTRSFAAKGQFIKTAGLRGFAMWEVGSDYKDLLLDSIRLNCGYSIQP